MKGNGAQTAAEAENKQCHSVGQQWDESWSSCVALTSRETEAVMTSRPGLSWRDGQCWPVKRSLLCLEQREDYRQQKNKIEIKKRDTREKMR